jgi:hypothetical protein
LNTPTEAVHSKSNGVKAIDPYQTTITDGVVTEGVLNWHLKRRVGGDLDARIKLWRPL